MDTEFLIITGLLLLSTYGTLVTDSWKRKRCFGILTATLSVISLLLFLYLQNASGGVDHGQMFGQRILPIGGYGLMFLLGVFGCINKRRRVQ